MKNEKNVVVVGAGCFGISTALHLLLPRTAAMGSDADAESPKYNVTVLDRSAELPAPDAASTDLNKVVRSSYHDIFYTRLAREAIHEWKDRDSWGDCYHECGVLVLGTGESIYADEAFLNDISEGAKVQRLLPPARIPEREKGAQVETLEQANKEDHSTPMPNLHDMFDSSKSITLGPKLLRAHAYMNYDGGWAHASAGVSRAMDRVRALGGTILAGKEVVELLTEPVSDKNLSNTTKTRGVRCTDGSEYLADIVVLATGAWTASSFPGLSLSEKCLATGQSVCTIQLTDEEAEAYRSIPVILDFGTSGFYMFPPNENNIIKFAKHTGGYANFQGVDPNRLDSLSATVPVKLGNNSLIDILGSGIVSIPRTVSSHGEDGLKIPLPEAQLLRASLRDVFPKLAEKPINSTRLCWYTDSPDSDWIIDVHPSDAGLVFATAGSGHAYKFLPVIGRLVVERIENRTPPDVRARFAVNRPTRRQDLYRAGAPIRFLNNLDPKEMVGPVDLEDKTHEAEK